MMNISIRVIENLHECLDILVSEKSTGEPAKGLMENGIIEKFRCFIRSLGAFRVRNNPVTIT
jgi:hypothetical protein